MKQEFSLRIADKKSVKPLLDQFHYLSKISRDFKSGFTVALERERQIVGVSIFTSFPVPELSKGIFGLERNDQYGLFELSRFCLRPDVQLKEHSLASWFLSRSIKMLRRHYPVRAILSYADSSLHSGVIYRACNFSYYGLTEKRSDFWIKTKDGFIKHSRGKTKGIEGEWRPRTRKHRFLLVYDKNLKVRWVKC